VHERGGDLVTPPRDDPRGSPATTARGSLTLMLTTVFFLRWQDMAPALRDFDPEPARRLVAPLVHGVAARFADTWRDPPDDERDALEWAIHRALLDEYGAWAAGWYWAANEPGCGGPVRGWCSRDSLFRPDDPDP
jgi:hypothetical protein